MRGRKRHRKKRIKAALPAIFPFLENGRVTLQGEATELRNRDDIRTAYLGFDKLPPNPHHNEVVA